jgi:hypothetical protein
MKIWRLTFPLLLLLGLILTQAACTGMKPSQGLPVHHPEALANGQQVNCLECHEDQAKGTLKSPGTFSHTQSFVKNHRFYAGDDRLCATCHQGSFCTDCHTNKIEMKPSTLYGNRPDRELPHRGNYQTLHKIEGKLDPASCYRCHGRGNNDRCVACHR